MGFFGRQIRREWKYPRSMKNWQFCSTFHIRAWDFLVVYTCAFTHNCLSKAVIRFAKQFQKSRPLWTITVRPFIWNQVQPTQMYRRRLFLCPIVSSLMSNKFYEAWNLAKIRHVTYPTYNEKKNLGKFQYQQQQQPFFWQNKYENCCSSPVLIAWQGTSTSNLQFYFQMKWL